MISMENLKHVNGEDGNSIIVEQRVELTEEDALDYIELDELLRNNQDNTDVMDILSDHSGSFSNDILGFMDWSQLDSCLKLVKALVL